MMSTQPIKRTMHTEPKRAQRLQAVCDSASAVVGSPFCFLLDTHEAEGNNTRSSFNVYLFARC